MSVTPGESESGKVINTFATCCCQMSPKAQDSRLKESDCEPDELQARIQKALQSILAPKQ